MKRKILFYNWDPIDGPAGGGVTAYLKEVLEGLSRDDRFDLFFLNSGRKYITSDEHVFIRETENIFGQRVRSFEVVNSPVIAPAKQSLKNLYYFLNDTTVRKCINELFDSIGVPDIIHFENFEGIPLDVLRIKDDHPGIRFIYSFHNYFPLCLQVNFWKDDRVNCLYTEKQRSDCVTCFTKENYDLSRFRFSHLDIPGLKSIFRKYSGDFPDCTDVSLVEAFYHDTVDAFNKYMDVMLPVSQRTADIVRSCGIDAGKLRTMYVGTEVSERALYHCVSAHDREKLRICFIGYMRPDKGFPFFLDALNNNHKRLCSLISVTIISRGIYDEKNPALEMLQSNYDVKVYNGFSDYDDLSVKLKDVDLGIVPVVWEDNLPRVAIEMTALGVPVLSSSLGGAKELYGSDERFVFKAGNEKNFIDSIVNICDNRGLLDDFWKSMKPLKTIEEHIEELKKIYYET